jgi:hypothetical protein
MRCNNKHYFVPNILRMVRLLLLNIHSVRDILRLFSERRKFSFDI